MLVARSDPLDQYVLHHPEMLTQGHAERALIDPDNRLIFTSHMRCASFELPFREGERLGDSEYSDDVLRDLSAPDGPLNRASNCHVLPGPAVYLRSRVRPRGRFTGSHGSRSAINVYTSSRVAVLTMIWA